MFNLNTPNNLENSVKKRQLSLSRLFVCILAAVLVLSIGIATAFNQQPTNADTPGNTNSDLTLPTVPGVADAPNNTPTHTHDDTWLVLHGSTDTTTETLGTDGEETKYYLTADTEFKGPLEIAAGSTVTICLNGYLLKYTGTSYAIAFININEGATFNLYDCNSSHTEHKYYKDSNNRWYFSEDRGTDTFSGGALVNENRAALWSTVRNVTFNMYGGAVAGCSGGTNGVVGLIGANNTFHMYGGVFSGLYANTPAIEILGTEQEPSTFTLHDGVITDSGTYQNGFIKVNNADFVMEKGSISDICIPVNLTSNSDVGLISVENGSFVMNEGYICNNNLHPLNTYGIDLFSVTNSQVTINSGYMCGNEIYGNQALFELSGSVELNINNLKAYNNGITDRGLRGVISAIESTVTESTISLTNCDIRNNYCGRGVINVGVATVTLNITGCEMSNNLAGQVVLASTAKAVHINGFTVNTTTLAYFSSVIYAGNVETVEIRNASITDEYTDAENAYNGIQVGGANTSFLLEDTVVSNMRYGSGPGAGVGSVAKTNVFNRIAVTGNTTTNKTLTNGIATAGYGAGIFVSNSAEDSSLTITDSTISNNTATSYGGGIYAKVASVTITGTSENNTIVSGNSAGVKANGSGTTGINAYGGGIYTETPIFNMSYTTVSNNTATLRASMYVVAKESTVTNVTVTDNTDCGELWFSASGIADSFVNIDGATVSGNTGSTAGGIAFSGLGNVTVKNADISGNTSLRSGGGLSFGSITEVNILDSSITNNRAYTSGGGIHVSATNVNIGGGGRRE